MRYRRGEKFAWHLDARPPEGPAGAGQRVATLLVYLTDLSHEDGGATKRPFKVGKTYTVPDLAQARGALTRPVPLILEFFGRVKVAMAQFGPVATCNPLSRSRARCKGREPAMSAASLAGYGIVFIGFAHRSRFRGKRRHRQDAERGSDRAGTDGVGREPIGPRACHRSKAVPVRPGR